MQTAGRKIFQFIHKVSTILIFLSVPSLEFRLPKEFVANLPIRHKQRLLIFSLSMCFPKMKRYLHPCLIFIETFEQNTLSNSPQQFSN